MNSLYFGDNLTVLRDHIKDESIDLVYLDPPFNSNANYNILFGSHGRASEAQVEAFKDTWQWGEAAELAYDEVLIGREVRAGSMVMRPDFGAAQSREEAFGLIGAGVFVGISPFVIDALGGEAGVKRVPMGRSSSA